MEGEALSGASTTDLVVMTCERLPLLKRTLAHIWECTTTPYRLHVVDDASREGNAAYVRGLHRKGKIASVLLRKRRVGISANLRTLAGLTTSDPLVFTDDDILCPRLDPDWLARGLEAMQRFPQIGMLALNSPHCNVGGSKRGVLVPSGPVTMCRNVPGSFVFMRRAVLAKCAPPDGIQSPVKHMCDQATALGWRVGYLADVYCQHIGLVSVRLHNDLSREIALVAPINSDTLEPADEYKG